MLAAQWLRHAAASYYDGADALDTDDLADDESADIRAAYRDAASALLTEASRIEAGADEPRQGARLAMFHRIIRTELHAAYSPQVAAMPEEPS